MVKRYHVVPNAAGQWVVKRAHATRVTGKFDRKSDAVKAAQKMTDRGGGELIVHGKDGRIVEANTYPKGFGSLKDKYVIRKGIDLTKPLFDQTTKNMPRKR